MHILARYIFSSLICFPLVAMDVPQKAGDGSDEEWILDEIMVNEKESSTTSQLRKLFATAKAVHTGKRGIDELKWNPQGTSLAIMPIADDPFILDVRDNSVFIIPVTKREVRSFNDGGHLDWSASGEKIAIARRSQEIFIFNVVKKIFIYRVPGVKIPMPAPTVAWNPKKEDEFICCQDNGGITQYRLKHWLEGSYSPDNPTIETVSTIRLPANSRRAKFEDKGIIGYPTRCEWRNKTFATAFSYAAFLINGNSPHKMDAISARKPKMHTVTHPITGTRCEYTGNCHTACSRAIACHPQNNNVACAFDLRDQAEGCQRIVLCTLNHSFESMSATKDLTGNGFVSDLSFSHDGKLLAATHGDRIEVLDGTTLKELHTHNVGPRSMCCAGQWNPQKTQFAFADANKLFITAEFETPEEK